MKQGRTVRVYALLLMFVCRGGKTIISSSAVASYPSRGVAPAVSRAEGETLLRGLIEGGILADLRWPDFSEYRAEVDKFYQSGAGAYDLAWIRESRPTKQARALIEVLQGADAQGLPADDYDGSRWAERLLKFVQPDFQHSDAVPFDLALTVCVMRYVSDLHSGRVNPRQNHFGLDINHQNRDLSRFIRQQLVGASDVKTTLQTIEPRFPGYQRTAEALQTYRKLARRDDGQPLPFSKKSIKKGDAYSGIERLIRLLRLLGDLPVDAATESRAVYDDRLVEAVKHFQQRHGLEPDGQIGRLTLAALNTPLSRRVVQLQLALERWRWLPHEFARPPIVVNIPEFGLHAYNSELERALSMKVVVGRAYAHETPVFASDMKYVIFRPPWNVPLSIQLV